MKKSYKVPYKKQVTFKSVWLNFLDLVKKVSMLATLFLIPTCLGSLVYYFFVDYQPTRVVLSVIMLWIATDTNKKM